MGHLSTKPLAILSAIMIGAGIFAANSGVFGSGDAFAVTNSDLYGGSSSSSSSSTTTTIPTTSTDEEEEETTTTTTTTTVTNPDTADEDWIAIVVALGVAGLAFSCRQYFARH